MTLIKPFLAAAAAAALLASAVHAQQNDFAGTWVINAPPAAATMPVATGAPVTLVISQTPALVTIERREGEGVRTVSYKTDGSQTVTRQKDDTATGQLKREGARLITETVYTIRGFPMSQTQVFSLSDDRRELTVESALKVEHGYEGKAADPLQTSPNYSKGTDVFRRQ